MGETRETRINEYQFFNTVPVLGLREGSWIEVKGLQITLRGALSARWFVTGKPTVELEPNHIISVN
jgi:dipeptidase E